MAGAGATCDIHRGLQLMARFSDLKWHAVFVITLVYVFSATAFQLKGEDLTNFLVLLFIYETRKTTSIMLPINTTDFSAARACPLRFIFPPRSLRFWFLLLLLLLVLRHPPGTAAAAAVVIDGTAVTRATWRFPQDATAARGMAMDAVVAGSDVVVIGFHRQGKGTVVSLDLANYSAQVTRLAAHSAFLTFCNATFDLQAALVLVGSIIGPSPKPLSLGVLRRVAASP